MSRFPKERFEINCTVCGGLFEVTKGRLNTAKFCSRICKGQASRLSNTVHSCDNCGCGVDELATHRDQINRHGSKKFYCSRECFYAVYLRDKPVGTKRTCGTKGFIYVKTKQDEWRVEHRLVAERVIGRPLIHDSEPILHIDGEPSNNDPDNLYVCMNSSELNTILKSYAIPYPVEGNLTRYKLLNASG